jgi:hypothetical protein
MATISTQSNQTWPASALGDSRYPARHRRPSTMPAYYQGRPAWMWLALFRRNESPA